MGFKQLNKTFIVLFSEVIWIYYCLVLFTSIESNQLAFFDITWWIVAAIIGYAFNLVAGKLSIRLLQVIGNIVFLVFLIIQNWRAVNPEDTLFFGFVVSIAVSFVYIRSTSLLSHPPKRLNILQRFEGNIIFYIIFAVPFTVNQWINETFHLLFIFAIFLSLMGMILTLNSEEQGNNHLEVRKVGQSSWFTGVFSALLVSISLISLLLLLSPVHRGLYAIIMSFWGGVKYLGRILLHFFNWLFSLFPTAEMDGTLPEMEPGQPIVAPENMEEMLVTAPSWLLWVVGLILFACAIWFLSKLMKIRRTGLAMEAKNLIIIKNSWWKNIRKKWIAYLEFLILKWRIRFSRFYHHSIYWYYHKVQRWGMKNGIPHNKHETSREYIMKLIKQIPETENVFTYNNKNYRISDLLINLNEDYQATYYGTKADASTEEYKLLLNYLKNIKSL